MLMLCFKDDAVTYEKLAAEEAAETDEYIQLTVDNAVSAGQSSVNVAKNLVKLWSEAFGDTTNPDVQKSIDETAKALKARRAA